MSRLRLGRVNADDEAVEADRRGKPGQGCESLGLGFGLSPMSPRIGSRWWWWTVRLRWRKGEEEEEEEEEEMGKEM
jgi:hypothetical protein